MGTETASPCPPNRMTLGLSLGTGEPAWKRFREAKGGASRATLPDSSLTGSTQRAGSERAAGQEANGAHAQQPEVRKPSLEMRGATQGRPWTSGGKKRSKRNREFPHPADLMP